MFRKNQNNFSQTFAYILIVVYNYHIKYLLSFVVLFVIKEDHFMTLKEIAKEAGVSISTVSRVVNNNAKSASQDVQDRIWEIIRRTGYVPNSNARNLKCGTTSGKDTRSLACLFARTPNASNDLFFSTLAKSIEQEAFKQNYILKYSFTSFDLSNPNTYLLIINNNVDGVAVLGRCDKPTLKFLKQHFHYVAYTGLNGIEANYDQILCDGLQAGISAVEHLIHLGHKHIGYIGETNYEIRYSGYRQALKKNNLPINDAYVAMVPLSSDGGYQGAKQIVKRQTDITAVFCSNDITAIGAMRALKDEGVNIPQDISVISIDDIDTAQYLSPMLSTIHIPIEEMGQTTAKVLIDRINRGHTLPMKITLPFYMASRESCAKPLK